MKQIKLSQSERVLLITTIVALLIAFNLLWFKKKKIELVRLNNNLLQIKSKILTNNAVIENVKSDIHLKKKERKSIKTKKINYSAYIKNNFSSFVSKLGVIPKLDNVQINRVSIESDEKVGNFKKRLFRIELESSFLDVGHFLENLENEKLLMEIKSVEVERLTEDIRRCKTIVKIYSYSLAQGGGKYVAKNM